MYQLLFLLIFNLEKGGSKLINVNKLMIGIEIVFLVCCACVALIFHENLNVVRFIYGLGSIITILLLIELIRFILNQDWSGHY